MTAYPKVRTERRDPRVLRFRAQPWPERPVRLARPRVWERQTLAALLAYACAHAAPGSGRTLEILIAGGAADADRPPVDWWTAPAADAGWDVSGVLGNRRHGGTYTHPTEGGDSPHGRRVLVRMSAAWFGDEHDVPTIRDARDRLSRALRNTFPGATVHLLGTPGRTGLDLLSRSLPRDHEYAPLAPQHRDTLWYELGQGRMEFCAVPSVTTAPDGLWVYDATWQYAACTRRVPVAPFTCDDHGEYEGHRPGFYRVVWCVPDGWGHVGLLPELTLAGDGTERPYWPSIPDGELHEGWVTHHELGVALAAGWRPGIVERILGDNGPDDAAHDPLRLWTERLRRLRAEAEDRRDGLLKGALRNILNQAIGSMWARDREILRRVPCSEKWQLPRDAYAPVYLAADGRTPSLRAPAIVEYRERVPLARELLCYQRPEWAASVWGASRAMIADVACGISKGRHLPGVPRDQIVAIRTDGIVTTARQPALESQAPGVGRMRLKQRIPGPCAIPRDEESWRELMGESDEEEPANDCL